MHFDSIKAQHDKEQCDAMQCEFGIARDVRVFVVSQ